MNHTIKRLIVLSIIVAGVIAGLFWGVRFAARRTRWLPAFYRVPAVPPRAAADRDARWQQDLDYLEHELPRLHVDPFHRVSQAEFARLVAEARAQVAVLSDEDLALEVIRIAASLGDAHTRAYSGPIELRLYPLELTWYVDGLYVTQVMTPTRSALHAKLVQIGGRDVNEIIPLVTPWISHENQPGLQNDLGIFLLNADLLHHLGVISDITQGLYTVESADGARLDLVMQPLPDSDYGAYFDTMNANTLPDNAPLWLQHPEKYYWYEYLEPGQTLYFRYSVCDEMAEQSFEEFNKDLFAFIEAHPVKRMVVDLRDNGGGNSLVIRPFEAQIKVHALNRAGGLYVLIDRGVFSSAVLNAVELQMQTQAILVGTPTSGRPNHYGEVLRFTLPNSQMSVRYSSKYFHYSDSDAASMLPAVQIEPTLADVLAGNDPVLDYVLEQP